MRWSGRTVRVRAPVPALWLAPLPIVRGTVLRSAAPPSGSPLDSIPTPGTLARSAPHRARHRAQVRGSALRARRSTRSPLPALRLAPLPARPERCSGPRLRLSARRWTSAGPPSCVATRHSSRLTQAHGGTASAARRDRHRRDQRSPRFASCKALASAALLVLMAAAVAAVIPSVRAARVEPMQVLREEVPGVGPARVPPWLPTLRAPPVTLQSDPAVRRGRGRATSRRNATDRRTTAVSRRDERSNGPSPGTMPVRDRVRQAYTPIGTRHRADGAPEPAPLPSGRRRARQRSRPHVAGSLPAAPTRALHVRSRHPLPSASLATSPRQGRTRPRPDRPRSRAILRASARSAGEPS